MSLLNVYVSPSRQSGYIGVDTDATANGQHFTVGKCYVLSQWGAVLAGRGPHFVLSCMLGAANSGLMDFDTLAENMLDVIAGVQQRAEPALLESGMAPEVARRPMAVALMAWREEGLFARIWNGFTDGSHRVYDVPAGGCYVAPVIPGRLTFSNANLATAADLERTARMQVAAIRTEQPGEAGGGKLVRASVSAAGVSVNTIADLDVEPQPIPTYIGLSVPPRRTGGFLCPVSVTLRPR